MWLLSLGDFNRSCGHQTMGIPSLPAEMDGREASRLVSTSHHYWPAGLVIEFTHMSQILIKRLTSYRITP